MSDRSRRYGYYRRRRRRPALLGLTAFVSVIVLAIGGLTLVGLDTVGSQGMQLSRLAQPELAQVPEVTEEESSGTNESAGGDQESGKEQASAGDKESSNNDSSNGKASDEKSKESAKKDSDEKSKSEDEKQEKKEKKPEGPPPPQSKALWMSVPRLGMYSDTVYNSSSHQQMGVGAIKLPPTGFPWQEGANTYVSAHRIGYPGTQSYNQFYALPAMQQGDAIYVGDANGTTYEYRVTKKFAVKPWENWVTEPVAGKDMISLQTCVDSQAPSTWWDISPKLMRSGPDSARLIVRAEKVDTSYPRSY